MTESTQNSSIVNLLRYLAIAGNILFILWMTWNGIDEAFRGTIFQKLSYIGLTVLLIINIVFLLRQKNN